MFHSIRGGQLLKWCELYFFVLFRVSENSSKSKTNPWLRSLAYAVVFVIFNLLLGYVCYEMYGFQDSVDWVLVGIYSVLSLFSFYVFVINDIYAKHLKGRAMALGFLSGHLALTVLIMSFLFSTPSNLSWYAAGLLMVASYLFGTYGITKWAKIHRESKALLKHELITDELTQLFNRRAFASNAVKEREFCMSSNSDLSVLILDLDDFKLINDEFGHAVGDEVLKGVSQFIKAYVRKSDSVYRWGGEEFVVLLPVTGLFEANQVANKLVKKISETEFNISNIIDLKLTVSIGVAQWVAGESISKETLVRADNALYKAKQSGKNVAVVADYKDISHGSQSNQQKEDQSISA